MNIVLKIKSFAAKIKDPKSAFHALWSILKTKLLTFVLNTTATIILVRSLTKSDYAMIAVFSSVFALVELIVQTLDTSIIRFYSLSNRGRRVTLVTTVIWLKLAVVVAIFFLFLGAATLIPNLVNLWSLTTYRNVIYLNVANLLLSIPRDTLEKVINAQFKYRWVFILSVFSSLNGLAGAIFIYALNGTWQHFFVYKLTETIFVLSGSLYLVARLDRLVILSLFRPRWARLKSCYLENIHSYCLPLCGASLSTYIKNYAPTFVVGSIAGLEALGTANILTNLVRTFHKGTQDIFDRMNPLLFKRQSEDPITFERLYTSYFLKGAVLRFAIMGVFLILAPFIFELYKVEFSKTNFLLYELLLIEFGLAYFLSTTNFLVMSKKNMMPLLWASLSRNLIGFVLTILLVEYLGVIGLPSGFLISTFISVLIYLENARNFRSFYRLALRILKAFVSACALLFFLSFWIKI